MDSCDADDRKMDAFRIFAECGLMDYYCALADRSGLSFLIDQADTVYFSVAYPSINLIYSENEISLEGAVLDCRAEAICRWSSRHNSRPNLFNLFMEGILGYIVRTEKLGPPECLLVPSSSYYLLCTPRSGSTFLSDLLCRTRMLGAPSEHIKAWLATYLRLMNIPFRYVLDQIKAYAKSDNGVFGSKIIIDDIFAFLPEFSDEIFDEFRNSQVYFLTRADKLAQAFSNVRSNRLDIWHVYENSAEAVRLRDIAFVPGFDDVFSKERWLLRQEADCLEVLRDAGIFPKLLSYEALTQSRQAARCCVDEVARGCGVVGPDIEGWSDLVRIGAATDGHPLAEYRALRTQAELFSTRSEPHLGKVLGRGWGELEPWGAWARDATVELVAPQGDDCVAVEVLFNLPGGGDGEICVDGETMNRAQAPIQGGEARLLRVFETPKMAGRSVHIDLKGNPAAVLEVVFYKSLRVLFQYQGTENTPKIAAE